MSDIEFVIELLMSLWKLDLCYGTKRMMFVKTEIKEKNNYREICVGLKEDFEAIMLLVYVYKDGTETTQ